MKRRTGDHPGTVGIESLVLAVPAAAVGLALTFVTARAFPALIVATFPTGVAPKELALMKQRIRSEPGRQKPTSEHCGEPVEPTLY